MKKLDSKKAEVNAFED